MPVRVGDTVRRPARPWTPSVQALLAHLRRHGIAEVPEPLGIDDEGREVVGHLPGVVPAYPMPAYVYEDRQLEDAAGLLRRIHDATAELASNASRRHPGPWQLPAHEPREVVCHNDFAPYNLVFDPATHALTGVIDFDAASPGPRAWDLAYLAYRIVPLGSPANPDLPDLDDAMTSARLARLVAGYGPPASAGEIRQLLPARLDELARLAPDPSHRAIYAADRDHAAAQAGRPRR